MMTNLEFIRDVREIVKDREGFIEDGSYFELAEDVDLHVVCSGGSFSIICVGLTEYFTHRSIDIPRSMVVKMLSNQVLMRNFSEL